MFYFIVSILIFLYFLFVRFLLMNLSAPRPAGAALASFISFIMYGPAAVLTTLAELDVVPPFDKFWMSSSLPDFWGRYGF
jgi:hypothetical protein